MRTDITISFHIPKYAVEVLHTLRKQNNSIRFEVSSVDNKLYLISDLLDFKEYSDDRDKLSDFDDYYKGVE